MDSRNKIFAKKTRRGKIGYIVREHYLREDVTCGVIGCTLCVNNSPKLSSQEATHFLIPDIEFAVHYLELLESQEFNDVIYLQTVADEVISFYPNFSFNKFQYLVSTLRLGLQMIQLLTLRNVIKDPRRRVALFCNEHNLETFVERGKEEPKKERNERAIAKAAKWFTTHLEAQSIATPVILVSDESHLISISKDLNVKVMTSREYISHYYNSSRALVDLYESLHQVVLQEKESKEDGRAIDRSKGQIFEDYLPEDFVEAAVKSGTLFRGNLRVNSRNPNEAWLRISDEFHSVREVFVPGRKFRNRAIHGDAVAVQLLPESQWMSPSREMKKLEEAEEDNEELVIPSKGKGVPTGKVVGIIRRHWRSYVCTIQIDKDSTPQQMTKKENVLCIPMDRRIPKIRIKTRQVENLLNSRLVVRIDSWDMSSHFPNGHYVDQLGEIGKLDTEAEALLVENGIIVTPFSSNMMATIPTVSPEGRWELPEEDMTNRRDLREKRIYSIDPKGSQDIDDALSVEFLPNGNFQVGVHIADVTYFVSHNSLLDVEAQSRSTTVYLAERKFDMLPTILSENLASLREQLDRPAVSVLCEFDSQMTPKKFWFGRTVIRSCHELNYDLAQRIFDDSCSTEERSELKDYSLLRKEIQTLTFIARKLRQDRLDAGALELESAELRFELNEKKAPVTILPKKEQEINRVVAEFMIFANKAVAERIYQAYPASAMLRHHPIPRSSRFEQLIEIASKKGFTIDTRTNKSLSLSLSKAVIPTDPTFNKLLRTLATTAMEEAEYISTGSYTVDEFFHYGLAAEFYTHFTSPIRRYADIVVHRQLLGALNGDKSLFTNDGLTQVCDHVNKKHRASKEAQRDSSELFQSLYFAGREEVQEAVIYDLRTNGLEVFIPKYGIRENLFLRDREGNLQIPPNALSLDPTKYRSEISVSGFTVEEENSQLVLETNRGPLTIDIFDHLTVKILVGESRAHRPPLRLELVHFGSKGESKPEERRSKSQVQKEMAHAILEEEERLRSLRHRVPARHLKDYNLYAQPKEEDESLFLLLERLRDLSISEAENIPEEEEKGKKKKEKANEEEEFFNDETLTDAELIEKRQEIEERRKSKLSVEERFRSQIGQMQLEMKLRALRRK